MVSQLCTSHMETITLFDSIIHETLAKEAFSNVKANDLQEKW